MKSNYLIDAVRSSKLALSIFGITIITALGAVVFVTSNTNDQPAPLANALNLQGACDEDDWDTFVNGKSHTIRKWRDKDPCSIDIRYGAELQSLDFILGYTGQEAWQPPSEPYFDTLPIPRTPYVFLASGTHEGRDVMYYIYYETEEDFKNQTNAHMVIASTRSGSTTPVLLAHVPLEQSYDVLSGFDQCIAEGRSLLPWTEQCLSYEQRGLGDSPMANIDWTLVNRQASHEQAELQWQRAQEQEMADRRARMRQQAAHDQEETAWQRGREQEMANQRAADVRAQEEAERQQRDRLAQGSRAAGSGVQRTIQEAEAIAACDSSFLGIPAWYNGLAIDGDCTITPGPGENGLSNFIWRVVLNLIEAVLRIVGYAAVAFIMYGGFKYMTSIGSPDGMASAKKTIMNAVIGLVISIAAVAIVRSISQALGLG